MAKFSGEVGYGIPEENPSGSGIWVDNIIEFPYQGDIVRKTRRLETADRVNGDISVENSISVVADDFALANFMRIKYLRWAGVLWTVTSVQVLAPRLILSLGEVYNGQTA